MANSNPVTSGRVLPMRCALVVLLATLGLMACSSGPLLESRNVGPGLQYPIAGTSYYLPKVLVRIEVWRFGTEVPRLGEDGQPLMDEHGRPVTDRVIKHFAMHDENRNGLKIIPDHRHQFVIDPKWDTGSDDYIKVKLDGDGLLSAVYGHATDERSEIARGVTDLFTMLIQGEGATSKWRPGARPQPRRALTDDKDLTPRFIAEYEFDPVDPVDRARVEQALARYDIEMTLTRQPDCPTATSGAGCAQSCDCTKPGIYYRLPIPYRFTLEPAGMYRPANLLNPRAPQGEWESLEGGMEKTILLPNEAVCIYAPVNRASFVTSYTSLKFERGMLREVETDKPSEIVGFLKIPIDATSAILAIPADLLTIRIKQTSLERDVAAAQRAQSEAERNRIESEIRLLEAARKMQEASAPESEDSGY